MTGGPLAEWVRVTAELRAALAEHVVEALAVIGHGVDFEADGHAVVVTEHLRRIAVLAAAAVEEAVERHRAAARARRQRQLHRRHRNLRIRRRMRYCRPQPR